MDHIKIETMQKISEIPSGLSSPYLRIFSPFSRTLSQDDPNTNESNMHLLKNGPKKISFGQEMEKQINALS